MPKLYEYIGIVIFFYSNEHEPIHVHARRGEFESKAEIILVEGEIQEIIIQNIKGRKPLKGKDLQHLKTFMQHFAKDIVSKRIDYFVYHQDIDFESITKKL